MIKTIGLLTRKPHLTHEEFVHHWYEIHGPLARAVPGEPVFADALARYFDGVPDPRTLAKLGAG